MGAPQAMAAVKTFKELQASRLRPRRTRHPLRPGRRPIQAGDLPVEPYGPPGHQADRAEREKERREGEVSEGREGGGAREVRVES